MNPTEKVVNLLHGILAGTAHLRTFLDQNCVRFTRIPIEIDGVSITFSMRNEIQHVIDAEIDGVLYRFEDFNRAQWIPPKEEPYLHWWSMMENFIGRGATDFCAEFDEAYEQFRQSARLDLPWASMLPIHQRYFQAWDRFYAYEPFSYLSDDQQYRFEEILKQTQPLGNIR